MTGKTVAEYLGGVSGWQAVSAQQIVNFIRQSAPQTTDGIKFGIPTFEVGGGPVISMKVLPNRIEIIFYRGDQLNATVPLQGMGGRRVWQINQSTDLNPLALGQLVKQAVALNEQHGPPRPGA